MSSSLKRILIACGVVAVFALLILVFVYLFPEEEPAVVDPSAEATASAAPVYYLIQEDGNDVVQIQNCYADGTSLTVDYLRDENNNLSYAVTPEADYFAYDTSKFRSMMFTLTSLTAVSVITETPEDLSLYGLDTPQFTMVMTLRDGRVIELYVGDMTPVGANFYAMTNQEDTVYTIGNYIGTLIMRSELEYRKIDTFPAYTEEEIYTNITWVQLTQRNGTVIEIQLDEDLSIEGNEASSSYALLQPVVSSCTDERVQTDVLDVVASLSYYDIIGDIGEDQLAEYGFDAPGRLQMRDTSGNSIDLTVGTVSDTLCYAAFTSQYEAFLNGEVEYLTVLTYGADAFTWLELDYMTLMNRAVWVQDIHTVESIDYELDGVVRHISLREYDDVTASDIEVVRVVGTLDGKEVDETDTKRLYARTLNLRQVGEIPPGTELGEPQYVITMNLRDGGTRTLELIQLNDRQYAAVVDGKESFYVYRNNVENILYAFERIDDDREVPLLYST